LPRNLDPNNGTSRQSRNETTCEDSPSGTVTSHTHFIYFSCIRITEASIKPALREVRRALLDADVNIDVADALIDGVKKRSLGDEVLKGVTADQQFIKAMYDELLDMMGGDSSASNRRSNGATMGGEGSAPAATLAVGTTTNPAVILLAGLQGAGKTTAAGKLALYLKEREVDYSGIAALEGNEPVIASKLPKRSRKVLLVAADVYRPAAIKQLQILGASIDVEVFTLGTDASPVDIATQALAKAKAEGYDTVIVDTAGRQVIDADLMNELKNIKNAGTCISPSEQTNMNERGNTDLLKIVSSHFFDSESG